MVGVTGTVLGLLGVAGIILGVARSGWDHTGSDWGRDPITKY